MDEIAAASLKSSKGKQKFYKSTFENISEEKREKILDVAISEFASKGYNATNINIIAKKAEISIGSMYSYFDSKEALFLTIMESGFHILEKVIKEIDIDNSSTIDIFERLLLAARDYAISYPEFNQIYLDSTTQGLSNLSKKLSNKMESISADFYRTIINKDKAKGIIRKDADEHLLAFILDNLIIMFQFSFTSDYYKERMKIFLGNEAFEDDVKIIKGIIEFVRKSIL
jgi:AcrR family transcriptional regulator